MDVSISLIINVIVLVTQKFAPSCVPTLLQLTPWWNYDCETAWQKMKCWKSGNSARFHCVSLRATSIYLAATWK